MSEMQKEILSSVSESINQIFDGANTKKEKEKAIMQGSFIAGYAANMADSKKEGDK